MTFFSGSNISHEKYPISERQNAVFPTQSNFIPVRSPLTRFPEWELYHSNCAVLERSAKDRSDPCAGHFEPREVRFTSCKDRFISYETRIEHSETRFKSLEILFQCAESKRGDQLVASDL